MARKNSLRICIVTSWPPHSDGIATYSYRLFREIRTDVVILASKYNEHNPCEAGVVRIWRRNSFADWFRIFKAILLCDCQLVHVEHGWLLYGDKIHSFFFPLFLAILRLSCKPVIVTMHTIICNRTIINPLTRLSTRMITQLILKIATRVVVHNSLMKNTLVKEYGANLGKIVIIPLGIDDKKTPSTQTKEMKILFVGYIRRGKGLEYLLLSMKRVLEEFSSAELLIAGGPHAHDDITYYYRIKRLAGSLKTGAIQFPGYLNDGDLDTEICSSSIIVLPYSRERGEPIYIESSAALFRVIPFYKPIICTDIPAFKADLIPNKTCIMVRQRDPMSLANAIVQLLHDKHLRDELAVNLSKDSHFIHWKRCADKHINLYLRLLRDTQQF